MRCHNCQRDPDEYDHELRKLTVERNAARDSERRARNALETIREARKREVAGLPPDELREEILSTVAVALEAACGCPATDCIHDLIRRKHEAKVKVLRDLLIEWRRTPFFDDEDDWNAWVMNFGSRVELALKGSI